MDGAAAIVIALVIMLRWSVITYSQVLSERSWERGREICMCVQRRQSSTEHLLPLASFERAPGAHLFAWLPWDPACQVLKIVGQAAPEAFTRQVEALAAAHHPSLEVDVVRWAVHLPGLAEPPCQQHAPCTRLSSGQLPHQRAAFQP